MKKTLPTTNSPESVIESFIEMLVRLNEKNVAVELLSALGRHANSVEEFSIIAKNFNELKKHEQALKYSRDCLGKSIETGNEEIILVASRNYLQCLNSMNEGEVALGFIEKTTEKYPSFFDVDVKLQKAFALFIVNRKDEAEELVKEIIGVSPRETDDYVVANFNMAAHDFRHGRFLDGLNKFIYYGRKKETNVKSTLPFKPWIGQTHGIENVILSAEAGIGDEFVNVRFLRNIEEHGKEYGIKAYWYTDRKEVREVFAMNGFKCIGKDDLPSFDKKKTVCCNGMEAPLHLKMKETDLYYGNYMQAFPQQSINERGDKLKVGLRWAGNPEYEHDLQRTLPIRELYNKLNHNSKNRVYFSFQRDSNLEYLAENKDIIDLSIVGGLDSLQMTMRNIASMDLMITSCTSIAHISASMGIPTWVLPPIATYYVWSHPVGKKVGIPFYHTNWYGKQVRIFQQRHPKKWDDVFADVAEELLLFETVGF